MSFSNFSLHLGKKFPLQLRILPQQLVSLLDGCFTTDLDKLLEKYLRGLVGGDGHCSSSPFLLDHQHLRRRKQRDKGAAVVGAESEPLHRTLCPAGKRR